MSEQSTNEIRHAIGAAGSFALRNVSGRVRLVGVDGDEVTVRCRTDNGSPPRLNVERSDGALLVEPERQSRSFLNLRLTVDSDHAYDFDVHVPRGARIDVKSVSADIEGRDLAGDQNYKTVSADLRLSGAAGRVAFLTVSGDVRVHDAAQVELDGATTSGDLTAEAELIRRLGVRTVSGDVRVAGRLQPGPRHSVETVSGDLNMEVVGGVSVESRRALDIGRRERGPVVVGDGSARLAFRSMSGDQRITLASAPPGKTGSPVGTPPPANAGAPAGPGASTEPPSQARLDILRALERGEIDIDEASRRLEAVNG